MRVSQLTQSWQLRSLILCVLDCDWLMATLRMGIGTSSTVLSTMPSSIASDYCCPIIFHVSALVNGWFRCMSGLLGGAQMICLKWSTLLRLIGVGLRQASGLTENVWLLIVTSLSGIIIRVVLSSMKRIWLLVVRWAASQIPISQTCPDESPDQISRLES